ncbi:MAG: methyltransferase domain-containing protein, partial [Bdellovibrionales bacterium]|nr:methyltransferase domain-containing protein [Bdellovibrionales bacterium]
MVKSLDHVKNWQGFTAESIPTKSSTPALDTFIQQLESGSRVLDCGCGCGAISRQMASLGFSVVGIDINPNAIQHAQAFAHERLCFSLTNIASDDLPAIGGAPFDAVVCQLLISIVGGITDR